MTTMATDLDKLKAQYAELEGKYKALDAKGDTLIARFITWKHSTSIVVVVLLLAAAGTVWLTVK